MVSELGIIQAAFCLRLIISGHVDRSGTRLWLEINFTMDFVAVKDIETWWAI